MPWHCKFVAHLLNLPGRKETEKTLETPAFKQVSDSKLHSSSLCLKNKVGRISIVKK